MDEIIHKRTDIDVFRISFLGVGIVIRGDTVFHIADEAFDIIELLGLQVLLLRRATRPDNLVRKATLAYAGYIGREGRILLVISINTQEVTTRQLLPADVFLLQLGYVETFLAYLDGFSKPVNAGVFTVIHHLTHFDSWCPIAHVGP